MTYLLIIIIIILIIDKIIKRENQNNENINNNTKINYKDLYNKKEYLLTQQELKFFKLIKNITDKNNLNLFTSCII